MNVIPLTAGTPAGDRQCLRRAALGDPEVWQDLIDAHAQRLWTLVRESGLEPDQATSVCELVWLRLAQHLPDLRGEPLAVWLQRVALIESDNAKNRLNPWFAGERRRQPREQRSG